MNSDLIEESTVLSFVLPLNENSIVFFLVLPLVFQLRSVSEMKSLQRLLAGSFPGV